jgi:type I restriction enzyme S subunit
LGEITEIATGTQLNKTNMLKEGLYPVYNGGINPSGYYNEYNVDENTIAISQGGASAGYVNFVTTKFWAGAHCYVVKPINPNVNNRFLYFFLKNGQEEIQKAKDGAGIPGLNKKYLQNFRIPIPPMPVQEEIVRILDKFTEHIQLLERELELRHKQYEYYRNKLLTPTEEKGSWLLNGHPVEWKTLGEVCEKIIAGGDVPKNHSKGQKLPSEDYPYPIYSNGTGENSLYGFSDSYKIEKKSITISARGTIGYHTVRQPKFTPIIRLITLIPNSEIIIPEFLNYVLDIIVITHSGGSIPQFTVPIVKQIRIPIPPMEEQERIVAILDKFDALVNDISQGLPAEIQSRKEQYEYYRNKLLTFKEKDS